MSKKLLFSLALVLFLASILMVLLGKGHKSSQLNNFDSTQHIDFGLNTEDGRLLIILLDSLQKGHMFSEYMPTLASQKKLGAWGESTVVAPPLSIAGTHSIFSGVIPGILSVFDDFKPSKSRYDNLIKRVTQNGKKVVIIEGLASHLYGHYEGVSVSNIEPLLFSQYRERVDQIFKTAANTLKKENWDVAIITCYSLDHVGHLKTPVSNEYTDTLIRIDAYIKNLIELTDEKDTVLITSEHGIDDNGFHLEQKPSVVQTGFVIWGPKLSKISDKSILQIDWAPTLSLLSGVFPVYNAISLPALDLLDISDHKRSEILKLFSDYNKSKHETPSYSILNKSRMDMLQGEKSLLHTFMPISILIVSVAMFIYLLVNNNGSELDKKTSCLFFIGSIILLVMGAWAVFKNGDSLNNIINIPFSANFIIQHSILILIFFISITVLSGITAKIFFQFSNTYQLIFLGIYSVTLSIIFTISGSYHPLSWLVWSAPSIAFWFTQKKSWLIVFAALWAGLALRRLTLVNVYYPINLSGWCLSLVVLASCLIYCLYKSSVNKKSLVQMAGTVIIFSPVILFLIPDLPVNQRALFLMLYLLPVIFFAGGNRDILFLWLSMWTVFYLLGTSSSLTLIPYIVIVPLFLAIEKAVENSPVVIKAMVFGIIIWGLYLIPGNYLNLDLRELHDNFIMSSVDIENIGYTVMIIASRFVLPASVLLYIIGYKQQEGASLIITSSILVSVFSSLFIIILAISLTPSTYPWDNLVKLAVISGYSMVVIFSLAGAQIIRFIVKLFENIRNTSMLHE